MRKIIQISAVAGELATNYVYALCDDGSLFVNYVHSKDGEVWRKYAPIPQPEDEAPKGEQ